MNEEREQPYFNANWYKQVGRDKLRAYSVLKMFKYEIYLDLQHKFVSKRNSTN